MDSAKAKRVETVAQLQRQLATLKSLCGFQLEKIQKLKLENARLRRGLEKRDGQAAGVGEELEEGGIG